MTYAIFFYKKTQIGEGLRRLVSQIQHWRPLPKVIWPLAGDVALGEGIHGIIKV